MRNRIAAVIFGVCLVAAQSAFADIVKLKSMSDVASTMDRLEAAVTEAGANVFARVDHAAGAKKVGMTLPPEQLLVFGNPKLGTPAMQADPLAGLYLPLRVLVYQDASGQTWLAYEDPGAMLGTLSGVSEDADYVKKMVGALGKLTAKAASSS
ncbi:DUF302 domain-containing protein [Aquicoccus sp. G2-2]|jgi:uncharacterized protein (DUF302 family)|uniref:DUF302 domain-containing protein n=1 Tax=Aquicoccus sp. G2-2 TaxID=3092120 RepID=UPI002ADF12C1|nr:DUF302 domain-containing protein [Aquicoccus sp. G2-2]MEA1112624.1 DUF302 domain-containing protein [Aquicoccus sp. G2-2]